MSVSLLLSAILNVLIGAALLFLIWRARRVPLRPEPPLTNDLNCACLEGLMTEEEHHEEWCPAVTGDYDGLVRIKL